MCVPSFTPDNERQPASPITHTGVLPVDLSCFQTARCDELSIGLSTSDPHRELYTHADAVAIIKVILECAPMPNVMAALPNIGGALSSTPQSLADAQY